MPDFGIFRGFNEKLFGDKLYAGQLPINLGLIGSTDANPFDSDYQAILNYATLKGYTLPSAGQQSKQNQLVIDLKDGGIWDKLDTFAVLATDGNSDFALIDWIRLTDYTAFNSPTFGINGGFTGNGTSAYIDTNYNPSTSGVNYTLNDASRFYWVDNRSAGNWEDNLTGRAISGNNNSTLIRINSDTTSMNSAIDLRVDGFKSINRTSSTNLEIFNNTTQFSRTATSVNIPVNTQVFLRAVTGFNASRFRFYGMGASLVSENTDFYNALNNYITSL
jgi:hypothetical protein